MSLPPPEKLLWMYETMLLIRRYDENLPATGEAQAGAGAPMTPAATAAAPSRGHEPVAVGVCAHLRDTDTVVGTHRPHHFAIAKGVALDRMAAGAFDVARNGAPGPGALVDLVDPGHRFSAGSAMGAGMPPACGAALAAKMLHTQAVTVAFFGDEAAHRAGFHESLNLAARWRLPLIFVCEDASPGDAPAQDDAPSQASNVRRAAAYGIEGIRVGSNEALAVYDAAGQAVARARQGQGPTLIDVRTGGAADAAGPQDPPDPIEQLARQLRGYGLLDARREQIIRSRVDDRVQAALGFASRSRAAGAAIGAHAAAPLLHEAG